MAVINDKVVELDNSVSFLSVDIILGAHLDVGAVPQYGLEILFGPFIHLLL